MTTKEVPTAIQPALSTRVGVVEVEAKSLHVFIKAEESAFFILSWEGEGNDEGDRGGP